MHNIRWTVCTNTHTDEIRLRANNDNRCNFAN